MTNAHASPRCGQPQLRNGATSTCICRTSYAAGAIAIHVVYMQDGPECPISHGPLLHGKVGARSGARTAAGRRA
jgi:hypothetical protein